jgi:ABC-type transport system involved in multi-copper enzyme maturation permease subunit
LALSIRSGYWNPTYLYSIGVQTFYFAILYSVSVLFGVLWRSWIGSILMTILAWIVFTGSCTVYGYVHMPVPPFDLSPFWLSVVDALYYVLPKTSHLSLLNIMDLASANLGETLTMDSGSQSNFLPEGVNWTMVLSTSSAFIVAMLGLSCWRFSRKDY